MPWLEWEPFAPPDHDLAVINGIAKDTAGEGNLARC